MPALIGLIFDLTLNIITLGWWGREIGNEIVWVSGDGFGRPGKD